MLFDVSTDRWKEPSFTTDAALAQDILENGGQVADTLSRDVTILLVKDLSTGSSKATTAKQRGIPLMTAMGFRNKFGV